MWIAYRDESGAIAVTNVPSAISYLLPFSTKDDARKACAEAAELKPEVSWRIINTDPHGPYGVRGV